MSEGNHPEDTRDENTAERTFFSELVVLFKENGALCQRSMDILGSTYFYMSVTPLTLLGN